MEQSPQSPITLRTVLALLREAEVGSFAAQAAFFVLLSAMPFLVFLTAVIPHLPWDLSSLSRLIPPEVLSLLPQGIPSVAVLSVSAATALWSASRGIVALTRGLNRMYGCVEGRNYFLLRFFALAETLILEIALLCTLGGVIQSKAIGAWLGIGGPFGVFLQYAMGWGLLTAFFLFLYTLLPDRTAPFLRQLPGAAGAALGWILFTEGFSVYASSIADFPRLYGTLSNAAVLMLWLWLCLCILFLGAFVNRLLTLL